VTVSGGTALENFPDFVFSTGPSIFSSPEECVIETQRNTYLIRMFMMGKGMAELIQGGETIKDDIIFDKNGTYTHYKPNARFEYKNPQILSQWSVPWRFTTAHMSMTDQEIGLNTGQLNQGARHHRFKTLKRIKMQGLWEDICGGMEDDLFDTPANADMEATQGEDVYSLSVFVNEYGSNFALAGGNDVSTADTIPTGFTTIMGINPTTERRWRNRVEGYDEPPTVGWNLFQAFSRMWHKLRFEQFPSMPELSEPTTNPNIIITSLIGQAHYEEGLRVNNDAFYTKQDPAYPGPVYRGIPVKYIENLEFAEIFEAGPVVGDKATGFGAEYDDAVDPDGNAKVDPLRGGPRYMWMQGKYMVMVFHNERYFYKKPPFSPSDQPYTKVMLVDIWHNLLCRSRRRQGIVTPTVASGTEIPKAA
jgi:hypothetical protein